MTCFDISNKLDRDLRRYDTRALGARLFAGYAASEFNAQAWSYIARKWDRLASFKRQIVKSNAGTVRIRAKAAICPRDEDDAALGGRWNCC